MDLCYSRTCSEEMLYGDRSIPGGTALRDIAKLSRKRPQVPQRITPTINRLVAGSSQYQPVNKITKPAIA
jgi:hypothetical protein